MNLPYFKYVVRSNIKFLGAFTLVLCIFVAVMINVITPATIDSLQQTTEGTFAANILAGDGTLLGFMSNSFYAVMAVIFPMVYSIAVGNRLAAACLYALGIIWFNRKDLPL